MGIETMWNLSFLFLFFINLTSSFLLIKLEDEMLINHQVILQECSLCLLWK